jgi:hypothetical protein
LLSANFAHTKGYRRKSFKKFPAETLSISLRRTPALALVVLLISISCLATAIGPVRGQANNGSFMQSIWTTWTNPMKKVVIFHISRADLAPSGTLRFQTLTAVLSWASLGLAANAAAQQTLLGLISAAKWAATITISGHQSPGDGSFEFTIVQISGDTVFAYYGICNMPLTPSCRLAPFPWSLFVIGGFSSLQTPGYWPLYF